MNSTANLLILGTRKGTILFERRGQEWKPLRAAHMGIAVSYSMIDPRTGTLWACLDHGHWGQKLQRSKDVGQTWEELTPPAYPEGSLLKEGVPATMRYLWVLQPGPATEPGTIYIGTEPGGLFVSRDGGESFMLVASLWNHPSRMTWFGGGRDNAGIHSVVIDPRDSRHLFVGVSCAGVFETTDGGATWNPRNKGLKASFLPDPEAEIGHDPHLLAACPAAPDCMWQQNHCGIFNTTDGGKQWKEVTQKDGPANFGFAVSVDASDPNTAWVVPGVKDECRVAYAQALCVCRTTDGGRSWTALRKGLPQEHCYDIVLRHALDLSGDALAFGSTTGNLFVSDDRGDSWRCLSHHLPPVYSVRFATV